MAEFCLKCWNKWNETDDTEFDVALFWRPDLCEGCGRLVPVVVGPRRFPLLYLLTHLHRLKRITYKKP